MRWKYSFKEFIHSKKTCKLFIQQIYSFKKIGNYSFNENIHSIEKWGYRTPLLWNLGLHGKSHRALLDMLRLFLSSAIQGKWGKWWPSGKSLEQRRHHPITILSTERCHRKRMLTYINQLLSVSFFLENYADLHPLVVVCFFFYLFADYLQHPVCS